jgi:hypothetical protein
VHGAVAARGGAGRRGGPGAGIVNQFVSLASFLTPAIYFGLGSWHAWIAVAAGALLLSLAALRHAGRLSEGELSA